MEMDYAALSCESFGVTSSSVACHDYQGRLPVSHRISQRFTLFDPPWLEGAVERVSRNTRPPRISKFHPNCSNCYAIEAGRILSTIRIGRKLIVCRADSQGRKLSSRRQCEMGNARFVKSLGSV